MIHKIKVEDMHCPKCKARIEKALTAAEITFTVKLEEKLVEVDGCQHCLERALYELTALGFHPETK